MGSYSEYVEAQCFRHPSLLPLHQFLSTNGRERYPYRTSLLKFYSDCKPPSHTELSKPPSGFGMMLKNALEDLNGQDFENQESNRGDLLGRVLIVEDLAKEIIETLGSTYNIDPMFFLKHLMGTVSNFRYHTTAPSKSWSRNYINIFYPRVISFQEPGPIIAHRLRLNRSSNVYRKVIVLPSMESMSIGLVQHCCSVFKTTCQDGKWLGILLCDPALERSYVCEGLSPDPTVLRPAVFRETGGPSQEHWLFNQSQRRLPETEFQSLRETLQDHLVQESSVHLDQISPALSALAYQPLKIVAREWSKYANVLYHTMKHFEYSNGTSKTMSSGLQKLDSDLYLLQSWRRRIIASQEKIDLVVRFLGAQEALDISDDNQQLEEVLDEYSHLGKSMEIYGQRLENMVPVVASLVQLMDSRRSFAETADISRLTVLALIFVPLTYVSSLFSMSGKVAPGQHHFWLYFAVALPMTLVVIFIARPPSLLIGWFSSLRCKPKGVMISQVDSRAPCSPGLGETSKPLDA